MATTWSTESDVTSGWTTAAGATIQAITTTSFDDNQALTFGNDEDFSLGFDTGDGRLEFSNQSGNRIASFTSTGLYLDQINLTELDNLPGSASEGRMIYHNNEYYLGVGS
tara:strand:- start:6007 stop:6336 length:330 start_codon:yes stop_codon:yes gene_type:complete